ncbi:MAG TPA: glycosyltransferase, partial [Rhizobiales bacterium]|nr:glycosyltransferase [Hyphomicrobiales bacterium]
TRKTGRGGPARLITVAMMRGGVKLESYEMLAQALAVIAGHDWTLTIIGDGRERARVEKLFVQFEPGRITWTGEVSPGEVRSHLADGDIFVWPGIGEAYGLAYLEAQAAGLPVVALDTHGVPSAVEAKRTALLTPPGDIAAYGAAIARLAGDAALRRKMAAKAISFARDERNIAMAADVIDKAIRRIS